MTEQNKKIAKVVSILIGSFTVMYIMTAGGKWLIDNGVV